jgi:PilZ domain
MLGRNSRRHARKPVEATLRVGWQDQTRTDKSALTQSFDISQSGMRFEVLERMPLRADVMLRCDKIGLQTRAIVRHCSQKGRKYIVGVEFAGGYRWAAPNEEIRYALEEADMLMV